MQNFRVRVTLRLVVYRQSVHLDVNPLETHDQYFFQLNTCHYNPYVTSSLTRGWVCRLQLLLVLASAVILGSESRGPHDHILLSQIRDSPNLEGQVPVLMPPGTGFPFRRLAALGLLLSKDHIENTALLLLRVYSLQRERVKHRLLRIRCPRDGHR
jgi:hypothetical protein